MFDTYAENLNDFLMSGVMNFGYSDILTAKEFMMIFDENFYALILED